MGEVIAESKTKIDGSFKIENIPEGLPCEITMTPLKLNRSNIKEKFISSIDNIVYIAQGEPCEIIESFDINRLEIDETRFSICNMVLNIS